MSGKILLTGGSGLLGKELQKYLKCNAPSHKEYDIAVNGEYKKGKFDLIIHCAAYTDVAGAEKNKRECYMTNVAGTVNILKEYFYIPIVYISSEYAHNPVNYYSETKLAAETAVKALSNHYLIIRTLFKPYPYPYERAWVDQYTQGDYVNIIAPLIVDEIKKWDCFTSKNIYIGTGRKTLYALAKRSRPKIKKARLAETSLPVKLPFDYQ